MFVVVDCSRLGFKLWVVAEDGFDDEGVSNADVVLGVEGVSGFGVGVQVPELDHERAILHHWTTIIKFREVDSVVIQLNRFDEWVASFLL